MDNEQKIMKNHYQITGRKILIQNRVANQNNLNYNKYVN